METLSFRICVFLGFLACAVIAALPLRRQFADFHEFVRRTPKWQRAFLALLAAVFIAYGSTKTNQVENVGGDGTNAPPPMLMMARPTAPPSVTPVEIARGWQLVGIDANAAVDYAMPEGAALASNWWVRGAFDDVAKIDLGGWRFPFGTNEHSSLWAFTWGKVRFRFDDTNEIVAVGSPMSAVPYRSRLWTLETNNAFLVTWEDFTLGRVPSADCQLPSTNCQLVSAQIELRRNGDFITRSNAVETAYRRICPEDFDDDGIPNSRDPRPYFRDGDFFGPRQTLPEGADSNAYCWVEIAADMNAHVVFTGDGESDLPDPDFMLRAGETNRVTLLIGKTYSVESSQPLTVTGRSSAAIAVGGNGSRDLTVVWPVDVCAIEGNGASFMMRVEPSGLGGAFEWTNSCCAVYGTGMVFRCGCDGGCGCSGCGIKGFYQYEGYCLAATGGECGCSSGGGGEPGTGPGGQRSVGVLVSFSKRAIIFEDEYSNTTNEGVSWNSTATELVCTVNGGANGGYVWISMTGGENLIQYNGHSLPYSRSVFPNEQIEFTNRYKAVAESGRTDDIVVSAVFVENETGWTDSSEDKATAVRVEIDPVVEREGAANRHLMGLREEFFVRVAPDAPVSVTCSQGWRFLGGYRFCCPINAARDGIEISLDGVVYRPVLSVIEPTGVVCTSGFNRSEDGCLAMELEPYITPLDVCFSGLRIMELPTSEVGPSGYFTSSAFSAVWHHTIANGAGVWYRPGRDNFFFNDMPFFAQYCPPPLSAGTIDWLVPIAWAEDNAMTLDDVVGTVDVQYHQVFTLDAQGGLRIDKFSQWIKCSASGAVTHSTGIR